MPTIEDLGKKVKEKYPGQYDDLSDMDLGKKVKEKYPDAYKDFADKRPLFSGSTGPVAKQARVRKANLEAESADVNYKQDVQNAVGQAVGTAVATAPFAAAAPFTGGTSLGVGLALMGAAGLAGVRPEKRQRRYSGLPRCPHPARRSP